MIPRHRLVLIVCSAALGLGLCQVLWTVERLVVGF